MASWAVHVLLHGEGGAAVHVVLHGVSESVVDALDFC